MYNKAKVQNMQRDPHRCGRPMFSEQKLWLCLHCRYCTLSWWKISSHIDCAVSCGKQCLHHLTKTGADNVRQVYKVNSSGPTWFPIRMSHGWYLYCPVCLVSFAKTQECRQEGRCSTEQQHLHLNKHWTKNCDTQEQDMQTVRLKN